MTNTAEIRQKGYFIRLFCSAINDPALAKMSDKVFRFYIYLHLLAKNGSSNGRIDFSLSEISWQLHWRKPITERCMNHLIEKGFVICDKGGFVIKGWNESQYSDSYERVKRFRNARKPESCNAVSNGFETIEKEIETETNGEVEAEREPDCVTRTDTARISELEYETEVETDEEAEVETEQEEEEEEEEEEDTETDKICRFTTSKNPFEEKNGEPAGDIMHDIAGIEDSIIGQEDARIGQAASNGKLCPSTTGYPPQYLFRRFQEEFPLCPWTPENIMDVIRNKILASKLWMVKEVEQAIDYLASKTPGKNATPKQLLAILQGMTQNNDTERARQARRAKQIAQKKEEERILRENEEWQKIHGKRQPGQALREIEALLKTGDTIHDAADIKDTVIVEKQV